MALDYTMTRDAVNSAVQSDLLNANRIGQSAAQLGYLGADAFKELGLGQGGLFNFLKGRQNPFTQESIEDPNRVYEQPTPDEWQGIPKGELPTDYEGYSEELPGVSEEVITDSITAPPESTGMGPYGGGGIPSYGDKVYDPDSETWFPGPNSQAAYDAISEKLGYKESMQDKILGLGIKITPDNLQNYALNRYGGSGVIDPERGGPMVGAPQDNYVAQPGKVNPINTALANEQGIGTVSTAPPISASNLQGVDSPGMPGDDQGTEELGRMKDVMQTNVPPEFQNHPVFQNVDQFGRTDEDFLNEGLDMLWNTNASGTLIPDANEPTGNPLMDYLNKGKSLINKGKAAFGLKEDENIGTYLDRLGGYIGGDNLPPWDQYYKDNYYGLEFDDQGRLLGDSRYAGFKKEDLDKFHPTYGWTSDARRDQKVGWE